MIEPYLIAFLELTFILIVLMLLHRLRNVIGLAPFFLGIGASLVFGQVIAASGLRIIHDLPALSLKIGPVIFIAPFMALLLITYVVDGTLAAQRLIWGLFFLVGITFYLSFLSEKQLVFGFHELDYDVFHGNAAAAKFFRKGRTFLLASLLSFLVQFLLLPMVYEILRNRRANLLVSVLGALIFTQVIDVLLFELVTDPSNRYFWDTVRHSFIVRATVMAWLGLLTWMYLRLRSAGDAHLASSRRPLDLVTAFLGAYGQSRKLAENLREWEGRYRILFDNNHDLIFLAGRDGALMDANQSALKASGVTSDTLHNANLNDLFDDSFDWGALWKTLFEERDDGSFKIIQSSTLCEITMNIPGDKAMVLDATVSAIYVQQHYAALISARDVTERKKLQVELKEKQEQLVHSQRMEAVGTLAGGIAHDFNNLLQAMQGSIDSLERELRSDPQRLQFVSNIDNAARRAAGLTGQLLGFARGGKYKVDKIVMNRLVKDVEQLFVPIAGKHVSVRVVEFPEPLVVEGDYNQLQQVLLNLLLNARDALPEEGGKITCRLEPASEHTPGMPPEKTDADEFLVIRIKDNGSGMDEETQTHIFEPFFTTKGSDGTGMGLAMVYGCIENHHGWVHLESKVGKGTEFFVFLKRARTDG